MKTNDELKKEIFECETIVTALLDYAPKLLQDLDGWNAEGIIDKLDQVNEIKDIAKRYRERSQSLVKERDREKIDEFEKLRQAVLNAPTFRGY
jgi:hypothetical protein